MKLRIYLDTSVIGGCFDKEFQHDSRRLFEMVKNRGACVVVSDITFVELESAPKRVRVMLDEIPENQVELVRFSPEASALAEAYINAGVITRTWESTHNILRLQR